MYLIQDFDTKKYAVIYSDSDLTKNLENIRFTIQKKIILDYHEIDDLEGYSFNLDLRIGDVTDNKKLTTKLNEVIDENFFLSILKQTIYKKYDKYSKYHKEGVYHILELID